MALTWQVPTIDIGPFVTGDASAQHNVVRAVDDANRTVGFMQITGHGIADSVIAGLSATIDALFAQPLEQKLAYRTAPEINRGYSPPRSESLARSLGIEQELQANDYFEAFNVGVPASAFPGLQLSPTDYPENRWPDGIEGFESAVTAYMAEAGRVARTLTMVFAMALGEEPGFFAPFTDHSIDLLRMNHYAQPAGSDPLDPGSKGMGEHTDYGIVTVLWADAIPGLQVLGSDGMWHDVLPSPGALLVNLGDLSSRWTNDKWRSTLHRVVPPVIDGKITRRRSAAFFHDGNIEAEIATIASCRAADGSSQYLPTTVGAHLEAKLGGSRSGVLNTTAGSEADRVRAARG